MVDLGTFIALEILAMFMTGFMFSTTAIISSPVDFFLKRLWQEPDLQQAS